VYLRQAQAMGLSVEEFAQAAIQRGMPASEAEKLLDRISPINTFSTPSAPTAVVLENRPERRVTDSVVTKPALPDSTDDGALVVFGAALFQGAPELFEPNLRLATPTDYVLGPGDQVLIDIYGQSEE